MAAFVLTLGIEDPDRKGTVMLYIILSVIFGALYLSISFDLLKHCEYKTYLRYIYSFLSIPYPLVIFFALFRVFVFNDQDKDYSNSFIVPIAFIIILPTTYFLSKKTFKFLKRFDDEIYKKCPVINDGQQ